MPDVSSVNLPSSDRIFSTRPLSLCLIKPANFRAFTLPLKQQHRFFIETQNPFIHFMTWTTSSWWKKKHRFTELQCTRRQFLNVRRDNRHRFIIPNQCYEAINLMMLRDKPKRPHACMGKDFLTINSKSGQWTIWTRVVHWLLNSRVVSF